MLIRWVNAHLVRSPCQRQVSNLTTDIKDSVVYIHLINQIAPRDAGVTTDAETVSTLEVFAICCALAVTAYWILDIGASAKLELVDKFCYLGDMLSVDGDADAAVEARIRLGWNKFRQLVPLLTNIMIMRGRLYSSCVRSSMLHGSET